VDGCEYACCRIRRPSHRSGAFRSLVDVDTSAQIPVVQPPFVVETDHGIPGAHIPEFKANETTAWIGRGDGRIGGIFCCRRSLRVRAEIQSGLTVLRVEFAVEVGVVSDKYKTLSRWDWGPGQDFTVVYPVFHSCVQGDEENPGFPAAPTPENETRNVTVTPPRQSSHNAPTLSQRSLSYSPPLDRARDFEVG